MNYKTLSLCLLFVGCTHLPNNNSPTSSQIEHENVPMKKQKKSSESKYHGNELIKNVNHYAKWLTQDLFANLDFPNNDDIFVITNFALLDSDLNKTNHFGRQMTEAIIHEVHRTGFSVIDLKASGFIRMTESGDVFYQSEDFLELSPATSANHIITGTLTKHQGGYIVNAKVILLKNKSLVSTAHIFVPHDVVDAVMLEEPETKDKTKHSQTSMQLKTYTP